MAAGLHAGRELLSAAGLVLRNGVRADLEIRGPERIAVVGPNGCGKTTLLDTIMGTVEPVSGSGSIKVPYRALPQRLALLMSLASNTGLSSNAGQTSDAALTSDAGLAPDGRLPTVLEAVGALAPSADVQTLRGRLARFLLWSDVMNRRSRRFPAGSCSKPPWPP